jgi:hypothetical protein
VTTCAADGGFASAVNCEMAGYTCYVQNTTGGLISECNSAGVMPPPCIASCVNNVFHSCQAIEPNPPNTGNATEVGDIGKDCTYFGAGKCVVNLDAGIAGCLPNDASTPCEASTNASCDPKNPAYVTGCATGHLETLRCPDFGTGTGATCSLVNADGGWFASSSTLVSGCYNPYENGYTTSAVCSGTVGLNYYGGPLGSVSTNCQADGLGDCTTVNGSPPFCTPP